MNVDKKSILLVLFNDSLGGAEQYLKMVAEYYLKNGNEVNVVFFTKKNTEAWEDLKRYPLFTVAYGKSSNRMFGFAHCIGKIIRLKKKNIDITFTSHVHINSFLGILRALKLHKTTHFVARESTSIFVRFSGLKLLFYKLLYKMGYHKIDLLICQTAFMKEQLLDNLPKIGNKATVAVLHNPIDIDKIKTQGNSSLPNHLEDTPYIVSAGRLINEKGFDLLIEAFARLKYAHTDLKLILLGEGEQRESLQEQINKFSLTNDILMPGFVSNVFPYFEFAKACVVSSRIEGFPNVLLQMMSQNTKVVSTLCAGGIDTLEGVVTVPTNDASALSRAIDQVLNNESNENRYKFEKELNKRGISNFINKVEGLLAETK